MTSSISKDSRNTTLPPLTPGPHRKRIGLISVVACFGGLLFGYDTGVSNGAETAMQAELGLSDLRLGIVISALVFAAAFGALLGGRLSDAWGRRPTITAMAVLFFLGTTLVVLSPGFGVLVTGRVMLGLAVGAASTVVPVYLAELAPYEIRGSITGRNELAIVIGQLAAFVVNAILGTTLGHLDGVWRIMFSVCALPAIALFFGMLRMPESPRWLVEHGHHSRALDVLKTVRSHKRAQAEIDEVQELAVEDEAVVTENAIWRNKWFLRIVLVGIGVAMAQQLTGINSIMYYGQRVLIEAGFTANAALVANIASGVFSVLGGFIALRNMDRLDRRTTFAIGLTLTTTCHLLIGIASIALPVGNAARPYVLLLLIVAFVFSMQSFLNVAVWVWLAEIFPLRVRGLAIGISVFFGWMTNAVLALFFPSLVAAIGITGVFFVFAGVGALALAFVVTQVPETRGISLEKLDEGVTTGAVYGFSKVPFASSRRPS
ncbi:sugar porter family MFS transporter [Kineococcus sp. SYSU DK003]|uniref:sugar porter family MFS transporter n=1 Tax=Kineococcus sp. SYSU DK003 TaxID=3383124 RepID=UPI003D7E7B64